MHMRLDSAAWVCFRLAYLLDDFQVYETARMRSKSKHLILHSCFLALMALALIDVYCVALRRGVGQALLSLAKLEARRSGRSLWLWPPTVQH
jgi:hypothetical protein